jgi:transposase
MSEVSPARRPYRSDLSDQRWALVEPVLSAWRHNRAGLGIRPPVHDLREITNAILYVVRTGIPWEYLPHDFPPYKTVYDYYAKWEADGTTKVLHDLLREQVRVHKRRMPQPSAAVIDSQTVKTSANVPEHSQGPDAAKKIKGRKRHIATDILGLLLAVMITAGSVQDSTAGKHTLDVLATEHPTVSKVWVDGGYNNSVVAHGAAYGIDVEVVRRDPDVKGFKVLPRRWTVERTLGWLMLHRRLARDYETLPQRSETVIHWAMIGNMLRTLTAETTLSWREPRTLNPDIPPSK